MSVSSSVSPFTGVSHVQAIVRTLVWTPACRWCLIMCSFVSRLSCVPLLPFTAGKINDCMWLTLVHLAVFGNGQVLRVNTPPHAPPSPLGVTYTLGRSRQDIIQFSDYHISVNVPFIRHETLEIYVCIHLEQL